MVRELTSGRVEGTRTRGVQLIRRTEQNHAAKVDQLKPDPINQQIRQVLQQRAHERSMSLRWNTYTVIVAYVILTAAIILTLRGVHIALIGLVAAAGLATVWIISRVQARRLERRLLEEELHSYTDLLKSSASSALADTAPESAPAPTEPSPLTERECAVLREMAAGRTNKETARALDISEQTVKNHIGHIFLKLGVNDRTSAVLLAIRKGWIDDHPR